MDKLYSWTVFPHYIPKLKLSIMNVGKYELYETKVNLYFALRQIIFLKDYEWWCFETSIWFFTNLYGMCCINISLRSVNKSVCCTEELNLRYTNIYWHKNENYRMYQFEYDHDIYFQFGFENTQRIGYLKIPYTHLLHLFHYIVSLHCWSILVYLVKWVYRLVQFTPYL